MMHTLKPLQLYPERPCDMITFKVAENRNYVTMGTPSFLKKILRDNVHTVTGNVSLEMCQL